MRSAALQVSFAFLQEHASPFKACAPGELAFRREPDDASAGLLRSATRIVQQCDLHDAHKTCPRNFRCVHDALGHRHVCCGAPASNVCVEGEKAYWNALDETVGCTR